MSRSVSGSSLKWLALAALMAAGCGGGETVESVELKGVDESIGTSAEGVSGCLNYRSLLKTTADLNLRTGPSTGYGVIVTMPLGSKVYTVENPSCDSSGWYKVSYGGIVGWASGSYLSLVASSTSARQEAIVRSQGIVGFSYWWGHGAWKPGAAVGSCSGSCPSCSHTGSYGADCSGFLAKAWVVPSTNNNVTVDSHPYGTVHFNVDSSQWYTISRSNMLMADAMVYNIDGAGHIFLYESGDGWGSMWAYECKGCSYGCVYNLRTASSSYHAIRHF